MFTPTSKVTDIRLLFDRQDLIIRAMVRFIMGNPLAKGLVF